MHIPIMGLVFKRCHGMLAMRMVTMALCAVCCALGGNLCQVTIFATMLNILCT